VCAEYCFWYYSTQGGPFFVKDERPSMETALRYRSHTAQPPFSFLVVPVGLAAHSHFPTADGPIIPPYGAGLRLALLLQVERHGQHPSWCCWVKGKAACGLFPMVATFFLLLLTFAYFCLLSKDSKRPEKDRKKNSRKRKKNSHKKKRTGKEQKKKRPGPLPRAHLRICRLLIITRD
jgi:hypothetical protein